MFKFKKLLSLALALTMISSLSLTSFAKESSYTTEIYNEEGKTVTVNIPNTIIGDITDSEIDNLVNQSSVQSGDIITIHEIQDTPNSEQSPYFFGDYYETEVSYGSEYRAQDYFVISAAKGQTTTLASRFEQTLTVNFGAEVPYVKAEVGTSMTAEYSVEHEFVGPPEGGRYNSREFRVQFYAKRCDWTQTKYNVNDVQIGQISGTAYVPTKYLLYSIDHAV